MLIMTLVGIFFDGVGYGAWIGARNIGGDSRHARPYRRNTPGEDDSLLLPGDVRIHAVPKEML